MSLAFKSFHQGLIDYAGLFPPAALPLRDSVDHFFHYMQGDDAWMLGSFVLPMAQLEALGEILGEQGSEEEMALTVLPKPMETEEDIDQILRQDLRGVRHFLNEWEGRVRVDSFEMPLPDGLDSGEAVSQIMDCFCEEGFSEQKVYFECKPENLNEFLLEALRVHDGAYYKLRCGGVNAEAFPAAEQIVAVIQMCRRTGVGMKFTAGLHHPVRHYSEEVKCKMFGFFNVFGAVMLAQEYDFDDATLLDLVKEENSQAFRFSDDGFFWRDWCIAPDRIQQLREELCHSYGSCSFDEPREDLVQLGWL